MKNICVFCGGNIKKKVVTMAKERRGEVIIIEHVPAGVCAQCGEKEFSPEVTKRLQEILKQRKCIKEERKVPVADFSFA